MDGVLFPWKEERLLEHTYPLTLAGFFFCLYPSPSQQQAGDRIYTALKYPGRESLHQV